MQAPCSEEESQQIWERVMRTTPVPKAHKKTSVLFLGWDDENDETEAEEEASCGRFLL